MKRGALALLAVTALGGASAHAESALGDIGVNITDQSVGGRAGFMRALVPASSAPAAGPTASIATAPTSGSCQGIGELSVLGGSATPRVSAPVSQSGEPLLSGLSLQPDAGASAAPGVHQYCVTGSLTGDPSASTVPVPVQLEYQ